MKRFFFVVILTGFLVLTAIAVWRHGVIGILEMAVNSFASAQVFTDLVIALSLFIAWMWRDARAAGRNPWPWVITILATGSIGALIYIIVYKTGKNLETGALGQEKRKNNILITQQFPD